MLVVGLANKKGMDVEVSRLPGCRSRAMESPAVSLSSVEDKMAATSVRRAERAVPQRDRVDDPATVQPRTEVTFEVDGTQVDYLLFDWLSELLFRFDTEGMLFSEFELDIHDRGLNAIARGEPADAERHQLAHEVKAISDPNVGCDKVLALVQCPLMASGPTPVARVPGVPAPAAPGRS